MILQPVLNPILLVLLCAPVAAAIVWALMRPSTGSRTHGPRWIWALRMLMLLAAFAMMLRPGIPGGSSQTLATDTDVVIAVDTTASIVAEDWDGGRPRLDGVRADVQRIVDEYPGARFALITFDATAQLRLPLTTDATALVSSLDVLRPEVTAQSRGSSIGVANELLAKTLQSAAKAAPDRARMVFYLGDGEQTSQDQPESFSTAAKYVDAGAVLGYGTADGGPMKITTGRPSTGSGAHYIEYQGEQAHSVIDEETLERIADQLGVTYEHRTSDAEVTLPEAPKTTTDYAESGEVGDVTELYWIFALVIVLLLGVELARATMLVTRMRGLAVSSPGSPREGAPATETKRPHVRQEPHDVSSRFARSTTTGETPRSLSERGTSETKRSQPSDDVSSRFARSTTTGETPRSLSERGTSETKRSHLRQEPHDVSSPSSVARSTTGEGDPR
ncbi:VWA domain-containing protein [Microbacterium sp. KUDC0406]|uniref:vWA domain-containing protein n=1 Tax=Microbacterium sp. KUDC0406 TaxID=2909588 RepID=UPI001F1B4C25|nr:VWA domain-containing protein [Microbacterium sp. KUDC0406]UJP09466.1 VWA domain-containing protein [Microbacterium sp. KUDC0406]